MKHTFSKTRLMLHGMGALITVVTAWAAAGFVVACLAFGGYVLGAMTDATARRVGIWRGR